MHHLKYKAPNYTRTGHQTYMVLCDIEAVGWMNKCNAFQIHNAKKKCQDAFLKNTLQQKHKMRCFYFYFTNGCFFQVFEWGHPFVAWQWHKPWIMQCEDWYVSTCGNSLANMVWNGTLPALPIEPLVSCWKAPDSEPDCTRLSSILLHPESKHSVFCNIISYIYNMIHCKKRLKW